MVNIYKLNIIKIHSERMTLWKIERLVFIYITTTCQAHLTVLKHLHSNMPYLHTLMLSSTKKTPIRSQ